MLDCFRLFYLLMHPAISFEIKSSVEQNEICQKPNNPSNEAIKLPFRTMSRWRNLGAELVHFIHWKGKRTTNS